MTTNPPKVATSGSVTATAALVLASILWGTTGTAATFFQGDVSPLAIGACTMSVGGLLLFAVSARGSMAVLRDRSALLWLLLGSLAVLVYPLAFYSAMDLAGIAIGNVVSLGSGPVFAGLLEWAGERRRPSGGWVISTIIAVSGVAVLGLVGHADVPGEPGNVPLGVSLGLIAGLSYATYTYTSVRVIRLGHQGRAVMGGTFGLGAIPLAVVFAFTAAPLVATAQNVGVAAYLALAPMFLAYLLFGVGLRGVASSTATTVTLIEPVVATLLAVTVVGERLTGWGWTGLVLILVGVSVLVAARPIRNWV